MIKVDARRCDETLIADLKAVLEHFPGQSEVLLEMDTSERPAAPAVRPGYRVSRRARCAPSSTSCSDPEALVAYGGNRDALKCAAGRAIAVTLRAHGGQSQDQATECRQCCAFCDKTIEPRGCIEVELPVPLHVRGREVRAASYMGCLQKVFAVEIDVDLFQKAERTRAGYGGVKAMREPLPMCPFSVERSYEGDGRRVRLRQPALLRRADGEPGGYRAFDLRDRV